MASAVSETHVDVCTPATKRSAANWRRAAAFTGTVVVPAASPSEPPTSVVLAPRLVGACRLRLMEPSP